MPVTTPTAEQPRCSCTFNSNGEVDTDGCVVHDLPLSGLLIGEPQ